MAVQSRLASAVMLLRPAVQAPQQGQEKGRGFEVFMVRRVIQSDFMPDVYVFPGGSVTADDRAAEQTEGVCQPIAASAADPEGRTALGSGSRAAAIRELFEEAGILLANRDGKIMTFSDENNPRFKEYREAFQQRKGSLVQMAAAEHLMLATGQLSYFEHWITPEGMPKRFDTHFFLATAPTGQEAAYDQLETSEGIWIAPAEALTRFERGEFPIVFATIYQLRDLAAFSTVEDALTYTATHHVPVRQPVLIQENGVTQVYLPGEADNPWVVPEHMTRQ
jgi:8-oxo-dGTP pyrophosphatase MutT (NUDIX family)